MGSDANDGTKVDVDAQAIKNPGGETPGGYDPLAQKERYDPSGLLVPLAEQSPGAEKDPQRVIPYLLRTALGGEPTDERIGVLKTFVDASGGRITPDTTLGVLALISAMPEYQLC
jgi:hypothetical protein